MGRRSLVSGFLERIRIGDGVCGYTKEQAVELYLEHRRSVLRELEIREVQRRIVEKILGRCGEEIDLVFFDRGIEERVLDVDDVLSEEFVEEIRSSQRVRCIERNEEKRKRCRSRRSKYVDLEADVSGDTEEDEEEEESDVIVDSVDEEEYEAPIEKHNEEMRKMDRKILENLRRRFLGHGCRNEKSSEVEEKMKMIEMPEENVSDDEVDLVEEMEKRDIEIPSEIEAEEEIFEYAKEVSEEILS